MGSDRPSCGLHEELARTTNFRLTRCTCGTVHLHLAKAGVTVQLADTMLAELVNVATAAHRKAGTYDVTPSSYPAAAPTN
jgi:hypothetical protein